MELHDSLQQYQRDGFCVIKNLIPADIIQSARERLSKILTDQPEWRDQSWQILDPNRYVDEHGRTMPAGIQRPATFESGFATIANHPNLQRAMATLLEGEVELFTDQIGIKHGAIREEQGGCSYYHQDSYYWRIEPENGCNCWIPFDDVGEDAIALAVVPKSHETWTLEPHESYVDDPPIGHLRDTFRPFKRHRIQPDRVSNEVLLPLAPGDGVFFTNYTWHRSEPNRSKQTKGFYAIAYRRALAKSG